MCVYTHSFTSVAQTGTETQTERGTLDSCPKLIHSDSRPQLIHNLNSILLGGASHLRQSSSIGRRLERVPSSGLDHPHAV